MAIQLGVGLFSKLVTARFLGKVNYGGVALGITPLGTVSTIVLIGNDTGVIRFLPRHDALERRRGILLSAFQFVLPITTAVGLGTAVFADPIARYAFTDPSRDRPRSDSHRCQAIREVAVGEN